MVVETTPIMNRSLRTAAALAAVLWACLLAIPAALLAYGAGIAVLWRVVYGNAPWPAPIWGGLNGFAISVAVLVSVSVAIAIWRHIRERTLLAHGRGPRSAVLFLGSALTVLGGGGHLLTASGLW